MASTTPGAPMCEEAGNFAAIKGYSMSHLQLDVTEDLINANEEWAQNVIKNDPNFFKDSATYPQRPEVLWIGCSDSRVPASVVTASMPGDIFTHTNIANQFHSFDDNVNSVLSFAVHQVDVKHVVLVGHSICGGAIAAIEAADGGPVEPHDPLTRWLIPLIQLVRTLDLDGLPENEAVEKVIEANIYKQVENICLSEPIVTAWAAGNDVSVHGWLYDLATGRIRELVVRSPPCARSC
ncbi:carbonic anhydrase [Suillus bovinus]|uniref:carbonic anhydrase n=1 Tax=Suillus bovinus TaxID=48563 RepID=UPI001B874A10|nr:carbonic anhydrase [Suillus bovinus]KAG2136119.1 carbonic anhydrase [Suillus bovinus]